MSYLKAFLDGAARAFINFAPHGYEGKGPWQGEPAKLEGGSYIRKAYWRNCGQRGESLDALPVFLPAARVDRPRPPSSPRAVRPRRLSFGIQLGPLTHLSKGIDIARESYSSGGPDRRRSEPRPERILKVLSSIYGSSAGGLDWEPFHSHFQGAAAAASKKPTKRSVTFTTKC